MSATQIAYMLGFSEPAAFQHAFQRWFGISVGGHRRALAGGGSLGTAVGDSQGDPLQLT
jgi:AraC-like DNA-binding protein